MRGYPLYPSDEIWDLRELVEQGERKHPNHAAFRVRRGERDEDISYRRFAQEVERLGNALLARGLQGRNVALTGENCYEWVLAYFACVNSNITVVPLDRELPGAEMAAIAERTGAAALLHTDAYAGEAREIQAARGGLLLVNLTQDDGPDSLPRLLDEGQGGTAYQELRVDRERPAVILFTSGTTGMSKGVMLCHRNLAADVMSTCQMVWFDRDEVLLSVLPIHHTYECSCGILSMLHNGLTICFNDSIKHLPENLRRYRPTSVMLVPLYVETFYKRIWDAAERGGKAGKLRAAVELTNLLGRHGVGLKRRLMGEVHAFFGGRLSKIICGGAYLDPALVKGFRDLGIQVIQGYGITECAPRVAVNRNQRFRDNAVGLPVPNCQVRISPGEDGSGEVLVRGNQVMLGYYDQPEETAKVFDGEWFRTGDIGYLDDDGFLHITGRSKNVIVLRNGKNILPEEIEALLLRSPLVAEAVVRGGGDGGDEFLVALVYPDPERFRELGLEQMRAQLSALADEVNDRLPYYKRLHHCEIREEPFPKNTSRKIVRYRV